MDSQYSQQPPLLQGACLTDLSHRFHILPPCIEGLQFWIPLVIQVASFGKMEAADVCVLRDVLAGEASPLPQRWAQRLALSGNLLGFGKGMNVTPVLG